MLASGFPILGTNFGLVWFGVFSQPNHAIVDSECFFKPLDLKLSRTSNGEYRVKRTSCEAWYNSPSKRLSQGRSLTNRKKKNLKPIGERDRDLERRMIADGAGEDEEKWLAAGAAAFKQNAFYMQRAIVIPLSLSLSLSTFFPFVFFSPGKLRSF